MNALYRFFALLLTLAVLVLGAAFYLGGQQMEYTGETLIQNTDVATVMSAISAPEKWDEEVLEVETEPGPSSEIGATADITTTVDGIRIPLKCELISQSDSSLSVRTWDGKSFDVTSIWKLEQLGKDVQVRQLMLGTRFGLARFSTLLNREADQALMNEKMDQLKAYVEAGQPGRISENTPADP